MRLKPHADSSYTGGAKENDQGHSVNHWFVVYTTAASNLL